MQALRNPSNPRQIQEVVNNIVKQFDNYGFVTLQNGQTETVVLDGKCNSISLVVLQPLNANAASALSTTFVTAQDNKFTIIHANAATERKFGYVIHGV